MSSRVRTLAPVAVLALPLAASAACSKASDAAEATRFVLAPAPVEGAAAPTQETVDRAAGVLSRRLEHFGVRPTAVAKEEGRIVVGLPRKLDPLLADLRRLVVAPGTLELRLVATDADGFDLSKERAHAAPAGATDAPDATPGLRWVAGSAALAAEPGALVPVRIDERLQRATADGGAFTEADVAEMKVSRDAAGQRAIQVTMRGERAEAFTEFTRRGVGRELAAIVDGEVAAKIPITRPFGKTWTLPFGADAADDANRAQRVVAELLGGRLPVPLRLEEPAGR